MRWSQAVKRGLMLGGLVARLVAVPQEPVSDDGLVRRGPKDSPKSGSGPLITFNLVALDAKGDAVRNLRASDLDIRDEGRPVQVVFCQPVALQALATPLAPNEYSNRLPADRAQTTVVVLDLLNQNTAEARFEALDLDRVLSKLEGIDRLYLYLLTQKAELYPVHPLPPAGKTVDDAAWSSHAQQIFDDALREASNQRNVERATDPEARVDRTFAALNELVSKLPSQAGPKSLVWISHGISYSDRRGHDFSMMLQHVGDGLARAGVVFYAVDRAADPDSAASVVNALEQLTQATGGVWISTNHLEDGVRQAMTEGRSAYRVGYRPPLDNWDGAFHKVRVSSSNSRLRLRALNGYFADRGASDPDGSFREAAGQRGDRAEIGIRASVEPSEKGKNWVRLKTRVDAADLRIAGDTQFTGEMRVTVAYYVNGWRPDPTQEVMFPLAFTKEQYDAVLQQGITLLLDRPALAGASKLRVVVRDLKSGAVGTLTVPVGSAATQ